MLRVLPLLLLLACDGEGSAPTDAAPVDALVNADLAPLPPRAETQVCAPADVDLDRRPDLLGQPALTRLEAAGAVALRQPSIAGDWWVAYADGRVEIVGVAPSSPPPRPVLRWSGPIIDLALAPDLGRAGRIYLSVAEGEGVAVWAFDVEDELERAREQLWVGQGSGDLAVSAEGVPHVVGAEGLIALPGGEVLRPGVSGRCSFDQGEPSCLGEQPLECEAEQGLVYRGADAPALWGAQVYACGATLRAREQIDGEWVDRAVYEHDAPIAGIFTDRLARLYVRDDRGVRRMRLSDPDPALGWPPTLTATGCLGPEAIPGPELIPYTVLAPLWTDGAVKRRWVVLPPGASMIVEEAEWSAPIGAVLLKQFDLPDAEGVVRPVETRIMTRWPFGWSFHTYRWRADGLEADLLDGEESVYQSVTTPEGSFEYLFPSRLTCRACHRPHAASVLGLLSAQLGAGQLRRLHEIDAIDRLPEVPPMPDPVSDAALHLRARATLHTQCAHCHRPSGWVPPDLDLDLRWSTPWADTRLCDVPPQYPGFGAPGRWRVHPGHPEESAILLRQKTDGYGRMPPASALTDPRVESVLRPWIEAMEGCAEP